MVGNVEGGMMGLEVAVDGFPVTGRGAATRSGRLRSWAVVLLAGVVAAIASVMVLRTLPGGTPTPTTMTRHSLTSLPLAAQGPVSAALGQDAPAYRLRGLRAVNPAQHLRTDFSRRGVAAVALGRRAARYVALRVWPWERATFGCVGCAARTRQPCQLCAWSIDGVVRERPVGNRAGLRRRSSS